MTAPTRGDGPRWSESRRQNALADAQESYATLSEVGPIDVGALRAVTRRSILHTLLSELELRPDDLASAIQAVARREQARAVARMERGGAR